MVGGASKGGVKQKGSGQEGLDRQTPAKEPRRLAQLHEIQQKVAKTSLQIQPMLMTIR